MEQNLPAEQYDEIPYFEEYFQQVLRPRVERAVAATQQAMQDAVWAHVLRLVAAEGRRGGDTSPEGLQSLRMLLEQRCGLRLTVGVHAAWGGVGGKPAGNGASGAVSGEVVNRRPPASANPLANAVMANGGRT